MRYEVILAPEAVEDLRKLRANERATVNDALERYLRHEPEKVSKSRIKALKGLRRPKYRLRVDDIRVFYDVTPSRVDVLAIMPKAKIVAWLEKKGEKI
ncbi:MAG TPA: type II toxin-antitoxin system RelE/ParE family toxin [bacterium]|nr:type II toxin-antitoxin system RelE/ParE family toxin [bacterium]